jgi:hypothetical protein
LKHFYKIVLRRRYFFMIQGFFSAISIFHDISLNGQPTSVHWWSSLVNLILILLMFCLGAWSERELAQSEATTITKGAE